MQRRHLLSIAAVCGAAVLPWQAQAQDSANWPVKPVRMLVGSAPGGGTDAMARAVADRLGPLLKQPVIVENRPGVSNTLAVDMTAKATDGHTMVMGVVTAHAIAPHLLKLGYDNNRDLVPVAFVGSVPNVLVVGNSVAANTVAELVAMARKNPGQINFASSGTGSTQHIAAEVFKDAAGIQITHVPYKGGGPAISDLLGGQVDAGFMNINSVLSHINAGKLKVLAITGDKRSSVLPNVPTLSESGVKGADVQSWQAVSAPKGLPADIRARMHEALVATMNDPKIRQQFTALGFEIVASTPEQFAAYQQRESARWKQLIETRKITAD